MQPARLLGCTLFFVIGAGAQTLLHLASADSLTQEDLSALSTSGRADTLGCTNVRSKPDLGLDLRFRTGFATSIALKRLSPGGGAIKTLVRVTSRDNAERTTFFRFDTPVPDFDSDRGAVEVSGRFAVGPGHYRVDLLNSFGRAYCVDHWEIEAKLRRQFASMPMPIPPGGARGLPRDPFYDAVVPSTRSNDGLMLKVLVNFSPAGSSGALLTENDVRDITAILRAVTAEPRFGRFRVVAFSSDQQRVLIRQPESRSIDFRALGRAVRTLKSGTVTLSQLADPQSSTRFLGALLASEFTGAGSAPDAIVIISPKVALDEEISADALARGLHVHCPVFLLSYNPEPVLNPWQGVLAGAIEKAYRGIEWSVTGPADLSKAILQLRSYLNKPQR